MVDFVYYFDGYCLRVIVIVLGFLGKFPIWLLRKCWEKYFVFQFLLENVEFCF